MTTFKQLRELITFKGGGTPSKQVPEYWNGDIPWASVKDFTSTSLSETQDFISREGLLNSSANLIPKGHVIIPTRMSLGKAAINTVDLAINQDLRALVPRVPLDTRFLLHAVLSLKEEIVKKGYGATVKGITQDELYKLEIPFPPLDDQIRIAHLLSKVEGLIAQRKQHLQQLDDLLKSVFLEMFGNIRTQESPHPFVALRPYLKANSGKSCKGVEAADKTDIPIFGGNGVKGWATKSLYQEPVVIAGRVGQQCGVVHTSEGPCWVTDNAIVLNIQNSSLLNIQYLATAFQHAPIRQKVQQLDLPFINQAMLLDYPLPLPPIELQNQFSAILKKVSAIRRCSEHSLTELQDLYSALSQKAFNGELDLSRVPLPADQAPQADQSPLPEDIVTPTEILDRLAQDSQPGNRSELLARWFNRYLANSAPDSSLDSRGLLEAAWQTLQETRLESEGESPALALTDYDALKDLVFSALENGTLAQTFAEESNRVSLQRRPADWGSF